LEWAAPERDGQPARLSQTQFHSSITAKIRTQIGRQSDWETQPCK
jgi:hypothetical protein